MKRALIRFGRVVVAAAIAGGLNAALKNVGTLPINDPATVAVITAALVAIDKYLRDKGVY